MAGSELMPDGGFERLCIERDCARLVLDSLHCNDTQDYAGLAALFTDDAEFYRPASPTVPVRGREAILASYRERPATRLTRHLCTNMRLDVESAERVHVHCYLLVFSGERESTVSPNGFPAQPRQLIGEFDDVLVRTAAGWRIASRRARFILHT